MLYEKGIKASKISLTQVPYSPKKPNFFESGLSAHLAPECKRQ